MILFITIDLEFASGLAVGISGQISDRARQDGLTGWPIDKLSMTPFRENTGKRNGAMRAFAAGSR